MSTPFTDLFQGFQFSVCSTPEKISEVLDFRNLIYNTGAGYRISVPDDQDHYSWHLVAEDTTKKIIVGSMRLTPWAKGPLEVEAYFCLPPGLDNPVELARFAILPDYRKGRLGIPVVSVGLFTTVWQILLRNDIKQMICASTEKLISSYELLKFERTGRKAAFPHLSNKEHELLVWDYARAVKNLPGHPLQIFFEGNFSEISVPERMPPVGLLVD